MESEERSPQKKRRFSEIDEQSLDSNLSAFSPKRAKRQEDLFFKN